jgi:hypothetical protein
MRTRSIGTDVPLVETDLTLAVWEFLGNLFASLASTSSPFSLAVYQEWSLVVLAFVFAMLAHMRRTLNFPGQEVMDEPLSGKQEGRDEGDCLQESPFRIDNEVSQESLNLVVKPTLDLHPILIPDGVLQFTFRDPDRSKPFESRVDDAEDIG